MAEVKLKDWLEEVREQFKETFPNETDEQIEERMLTMLLDAYCQDVISMEELRTITSYMGYEIDEDIVEMIKEELKKRKSQLSIDQ